MLEEDFWIKLKQAWLYDWNKFKKICLDCWSKMNRGKKVKLLLTLTVLITLIIIFFSTDLSARVFNWREYKVYEYALECVEDELKFPNTAKLPSFKDVSIRKSKYTVQIILDPNNSGKDMKYAWDISGYGTCENAAGMRLNFSFNVTVVLSKYGEFWCYKCEI